jgi:iron complex outermembrane receptor protein
MEKRRNQRWYTMIAARVLFLSGVCISLDVKCEVAISNASNVTRHLVNIQSSLNVAEALNLLVKQTQTLLIFPYDIAKSHSAKAVNGNYSIKKALDLILYDSGLVADFSERGIIRLRIADNDNITNKKRNDMKPQKTILASIMSLMFSTAHGAEDSEKHNQVNHQEVERIVVTGSSIKRTDVEGALPITTISQEQIQRSGVTSVSELMTKIPQMQGYSTGAETAGGSTDGISDASLRDLGGQYTLVLLNGRRLAAADSGGKVDLNSIPLSAIERVEVLTDGASAIYGSDAIAGVINFILKKELQETTISVRFDKPQESGGSSSNFSISTGFGELESDGFNLMLSYSHDKQSSLKSSERDFANTGILPFSYQGQDLTLVRASSDAIPANAYLTFDDGSTKSLNPYNEFNGQCAADNAPQGSSCIYDFTEALNILPETTRDSVFVQSTFQLKDGTQLYSNLSWSQFDLNALYSPFPTYPFLLDTDSQLVQDNVYPHITQGEIDSLEQVAVRWRTLPGGNRVDKFDTETKNFTTGIRGDINDLNYDLAFTYADSKRDKDYVSGYPLEDELISLLQSGEINIFDAQENLTAAENKAVADVMYSGNWQTTNTSSIAIEGKASMPVLELPEGDAYIGFGFDYRQNEYNRTNSEANNSNIILLHTADPEYDLSRSTYGVFLETIAPLADGLELTAAIRYDNIGKITDSKRPTGEQSVNSDLDDTTYKVSLAYRPSDSWLIRASIGSGFKAPSMIEISETRALAGPTSASYNCPFSANDSMAQYCYSEPSQYYVYNEGYSDLRPEKSTQSSIGFVYAPDNDFSFNIDWWQVDLHDQVSRLTQDQIWNNPDIYRDLFGTRIDSGTNDEILTITQAAVNIGESNNSGIDWGLNITNELSFGTLKSSIGGTYIIESKKLRVGTDDQFDSSLGKYGTNNAVTFRNIIQMVNTLSHGDFTHTASLSYRSGYEDVYHAAGSNRVRLASDLNSYYQGGVQLRVPSYMTVNYISTYHYDDNLNITIGINNLFDKQPPLSLRVSGSYQVGYDPRYVDALGRTFYLSGSYTF